MSEGEREGKLTTGVRDCEFLGRIWGPKDKETGKRDVKEFCVATHGVCLIDPKVASIDNCTRRAWLLVQGEKAAKGETPWLDAPPGGPGGPK